MYDLYNLLGVPFYVLYLFFFSENSAHSVLLPCSDNAGLF